MPTAKYTLWNLCKFFHRRLVMNGNNTIPSGNRCLFSEKWLQDIFCGCWQCYTYYYRNRMILGFEHAYDTILVTKWNDLIKTFEEKVRSIEYIIIYMFSRIYFFLFTFKLQGPVDLSFFLVFQRHELLVKL